MKPCYDEILEKCPSIITLDQFYRICHISKRKAKWLLDNRKLPCQYSGSIKRHYIIRTTDLINFLYATDGLTTNIDFGEVRFTAVTPAKSTKNSLATVNPISFCNYLSKAWEKESDVLPYSSVQCLVGYHIKTIGKWASQGKILVIGNPIKPIVLKESLISHIASYTVRYPKQTQTRRFILFLLATTMPVKLIYMII